jgi:outer membrane protein assembly factor BamB
VKTVLLIISILLSNLVLAQQVPAPVPGFVHEASSPSNNSDGDFAYGTILSSASSGISSPVIADIDGNLANGLEVAVVSRDARISVLSADGRLLWERDLPNHKCKTKRNDLAYSSPAVGALYGDGRPYVVVGYGGMRTKSCGGGVVAFKGDTGKQVWHFNLKRFAKRNRVFSVSHAVFGTPALADVNGNGKLEIGFGSLDRNVYMLNHQGRLQWYYHAADTVFSSPVFYNINKDPQLEMIIGTDISANKYLKPATRDGGMIYALKTDATGGKYFGFRDSKARIWMRIFDQVIQSSPVIADVIPGGDPEIIVGSGCYFPENSNDKRGKWIKILRLSNGKVLRTLNTEACLNSTPAIADINGDGNLEIVATVNGNATATGTSRGKLAAWRADSSEPIWITEPRALGQNDFYLGTFQSPVIADIDGNGSLEIVIVNTAAVGVYDAATGTSYGCDTRTCNSHDLLLFTSSTLKNTPAIADLNLDGRLDLIIAGTSRAQQRQAVFAWTNFADLSFSAAGPHASYALPWGQFKKNAHRQPIF